MALSVNRSQASGRDSRVPGVGNVKLSLKVHWVHSKNALLQERLSANQAAVLDCKRDLEEAEFNIRSIQTPFLPFLEQPM